MLGEPPRRRLLRNCSIVTWDRLAENCAQFLSKGPLVDVEWRLQTRQWDEDAGRRPWRTEEVVLRLAAFTRAD